MNENQWNALCDNITNIYNNVKNNKDGNVASYIPQLAKVDPDLFGISIQTLDGKVFNIGNTDNKFCIQSCSKPISYCLALQEHGLDHVSNHIGKEPSGNKFNAIGFDDNNKPFNPLINAGAIMSCSLIKQNEKDDVRFEHILNTWKKIIGPDNYVGFDNAVYLSEKLTANRNYALAHIMMENNVFPQGTDIEKTLQLYFQSCSIVTDCKSLVKCATMLCNGGIIEDRKIFTPSICRDILCIMYSSGMYDYSGRWSFDIGLPAKSGVGGSIYAIIPNFGGICTYSPRLDKNGNSVRGIQFFTELVKSYRMHIFDTLVNGLEKKTDIKENDNNINKLYSICKSRSTEDLFELLKESELDINYSDYDGRTPLHILIDERKYKSILLLLKNNVNYKKKDRWNNSLITSNDIYCKSTLLYYLTYKLAINYYFNKLK